MAAIASIDLPKDKRIEVALTYIYGIGQPTATKICKETGVDPDLRVKDMSEDDTPSSVSISTSILSLRVTSEEELLLISRDLLKSRCYRGVRHRKDFL